MSEELVSLVEACKKGDKEAWGPFVKECGRRIRGYLWKPCRGKREEIDEITQQVWIKLLKGGLRDFRGTSHYEFLAFLKTVTIHEASTYFKRGTTQKDNDDDENITARPISSIRSADDEGQPGNDVGKKMDLEREKERLRECMKGLPLRQQEIAMMKAKDYKDAEIGKILGLPLGTVAVSYSRLKNKLRECMDRI